jgi:hypothetical protein
MSDLEGLLAEQALYYRERAGEYDDWWFRRGRYDHGPETNARWFADAAEVQDALEGFDPAGDVLELACGTGLWTQRLVSHATSVIAIDGSPEMRASDMSRPTCSPGSQRRHTTCVSSASDSHTSPRSASMIFGRKSGAPSDPKAGCSSLTACAATRLQPPIISSPIGTRRRCSAGSPTVPNQRSLPSRALSKRYALIV